MTTINSLIATATKAGFESYGSFNEGELQHDILTCTKGKYSGEVIDLYYFYSNGFINEIQYSTQFHGQPSTFRFTSLFAGCVQTILN